LHFPFIFFPTPFPLTTQIQHISSENEENEKGTPLNTHRFDSINKKLDPRKITFKYTQTDDYHKTHKNNHK
jgi:hypothetical protein